MNIYLKEVVYLLPVITLFTIAAYLIGGFLLQFIEPIRNKKLLFSDCITFGFFVLILVFSILYSKGNSFLVIPLIASVLFGLSQNVFCFRPLKLWSLHIPQLIGFILVFFVISIGMILLVQFDNRLLIHPDISSYTRLAYNMKLTSQEKLILDPIYIGEYPKQLFHFFNEWISVLFSLFLEDFSMMKILLYVTLPILTTLMFFQLTAIINILLKESRLLDRILISALILFLPNLCKILYHLTSSQSAPSSSILHSGLFFIKLKVIILISLVSFKLYLENKKNFAIFIFSMIPIIWNTLVPVFIIGFILMLIYQILNKEKISKAFYGIQLLNFSLLFIIIYLNPNAKDVMFSYSFFDYIVEEYSNTNFLWQVLIYLSISSLPLIILFKKRLRIYFQDTFKAYLFFLLVASGISFSLIFKLHNAQQLIINFLFPLLFPLAIYLVSLAYDKHRKRSRLGVSAVLVVVICHAVLFSKSFKTEYKVPTVFNSKIPVFLASDLNQSIRDSFYYYIRPYGFLMLENEHWLPQRIDLLDHTKFNTPVDKYHYFQSVGNQSFFKYAALQNDKKDSIKPSELKFNFLKDYKFEYLLVNTDKVNSDQLNYLQNLNIVDKQLFDNDVILLKLKWN